jgi:hypothetical protein
MRTYYVVFSFDFKAKDEADAKDKIEEATHKMEQATGASIDVEDWGSESH